VGTLPYNKVFKTKPVQPIRSKLPGIPQLFNGEQIVLKDDFFRILSERKNPALGGTDVEANLTIYYNVFAIPFGYDTLEVYFNVNGNKEGSKLINLYERLNSREHEIVSYIKGIIKNAAEVVKARGLNKGEKESFYSRIFSSLASQPDPITGGSIDSIVSRFPEISIDSNVASLYHNTYYESVDNLNSIVPRNVIPVTKDFKEICKKIFEISNTEESYTGFQKECFKSISQNRDPLKTFMKANFLKSDSARNEIPNLSQEERELVTHFMKSSGIVPKQSSKANNYKFLSDVSLVNDRTNLKKISVRLLIPSYSKEKIEYLTVSLVNRENPNEVFEVKTAYSILENQVSISNIAKANDIGNYPISIPIKSKKDLSCYINDVVIEKSQYVNRDINAYSFDRSVSKNEISNSAFQFKNLKKASPKQLITTFDLGALADNNLRRDLISNKRTGELIVNSTVSPNKLIGAYNRSQSAQDFSNVKAYVTTISRNDLNNFPANLIKLFSLKNELKIVRVVCEPLNSGSKFQIPVFNPSSTVIKHVDPTPGAKYKYSIHFRHINGDFIEEPLIINHRTLPSGLPNIKLHYNGVREEKYAHIVLNSDSITNVAKEVETGLKKAFSNSEGAKNFYSSIFEEKIKEDLQNIGNIFQLFVEYYYPKTGNYGKHVILDLISEEGINEFRVPLPAIKHSNIIMSYNLIVTNPIEILSNGIEKVEKKETREIFRRRTAAFFNSFSLTSGILPVSVTNPETGREEYTSNSKFPVRDIFNKVCCIGGFKEFTTEQEPNKANISMINALYSPDDGESIVSWKVAPSTNNPLTSNKNIDFFVVTGTINSTEIPISCHPFVNFNYEYKIRTCSFLGSAAKVKFKVYIVYSDYTIEKSNISYELEITDIRKYVAED